VLVLPAVALAQVEKRIALLIDNQAHTPEIGVLANPHNDVALLERLRSWRRAEDLPARIARRFSRSSGCYGRLLRPSPGRRRPAQRMLS
jgi:hypothetical protein